MKLPQIPFAIPRFAAWLILLVVAIGGPTLARAETNLIPAGADWKYLDNGSNQGTAWRDLGFSDASWNSGPAELGYGDASEGRPEATVVSYGPNSSAKYITTYFRRTFDVADASAFATLKLRVIRDDGVVVYLNGQEIWRDRMPTGTIGYQTLATSAIGGADEYTFLETLVPSTHLRTGQNVLAVEIHQANATSSDISFDLELFGRPAGLVRMPYLQIGTPTSVVVRWRTDIATDSVVRYGSSPTALTSTVTANAGTPTTEHEVTLTGLTPDTRYYYSVGSSGATYAGGESHVFYTSPPAGQPHPTRIWVLGDAGTGTANQLAVRNAYYSFAQGAYTDVLLMLGDNVYETGTDIEYTTRHFGVYYEMLRQTVSWPTIGNHDTGYSNNPSPTIPYYESFSMPTAGQAGGIASGTEDYYSFDYGDIHFICLDSMTENRGKNGAMATWLKQDLANTTQKWIIAYWHHPPYSKGHDSDTDTIETEMRTNIVPILEDYGVDLVLFGHSHAYERSYLMDGHYGLSSTFNSATMVKDGTDGRGVGGYNKPTFEGAGHEGAVYAVAGSSGKVQNYSGITDNGTGNGVGHAAMFISWERLGSLVIDVDGHKMDVKFLRETGLVADSFSITRGPRTNAAPNVAIASPADGAEFNLGAPITINATASDSDQGVSQVVFYANSSRIATLPGAAGNSYAFTWTPPVVGNYRFEVRAVDQLGNSGNSAPVDVVVSVGAPAPDTIAPAAIANLAAVPGLTDVSLSWRAPGDDGADSGAAASYDLRYSTTDPASDPDEDKATWWAAATQVADEPLPLLAGNTQNHAVTGLSPETTYYFAIRATDDAANQSLISNVAAATTLVEPPAPPTSLIASRAEGGGVNLSWTDNSADEDGFSIERSLDKAGGFVQIQAVAANVTSFTDSIVYPGNTYFYRVIATNGAVASAHSNVAQITMPPAAPTNLVATSTTTAVSLTWDASAGAASYTVSRLDGETGNYETVSSGLTETNYTDAGLASGTSYSYRVSAVNVGGTGSPAEVTIQTKELNPPSAPASLVATATGTSTIQLQWTDTASNETGFAIERSNDGVAFAQIATTAADATAFGDANLTQGTAYWYRVRASNADGYSAYSNTASATTMVPPPPAAPSNLTATSTLTEVTLNWDGNPDVQSYTVGRLNPATGNYETLSSGLTTTTYTDSGLESGTSYSYEVYALNGGGAGPSAEITIQTKQLNPPSAPTTLAATATGTSTIELSWADTANNETGFAVERSTDGVAFVQIASLGADSSSFGDVNLAQGTQYWYRVRAFNADGPSGYSNTASATTMMPQPPAAPSDLVATAISGTEINLAWTDHADDEDGFSIERSENGGAFGVIAMLAANATTYADSGLSSGSTYTYRVQAFNAAGGSVYSDPASAKTLVAPTAPANLIATAVAKAEIDLTWTDTSDSETSFVIERSPNQRSYSVIATVNANTTSYEDRSVAAGKTYYYRVKAVNSVGESAYSNTDSATTPKK